MAAQELKFKEDFPETRRSKALSQHESSFHSVKAEVNAMDAHANRQAEAERAGASSGAAREPGDAGTGGTVARGDASKGDRDDSVKTVRAVERALDILECFNFDRRELTLTEIAQSTHLPLATAYRLVKILERRRWVRSIGTGNRYQPGPKLLEGGAVALSGFTLREKAQPVLDALASETSGTVLMGAVYEDRLVYIDRRDSRAELRVVSAIGQVRPVTYGILGKLLLAYMPEEYVRGVLAKTPLEKRGSRSIVSEEEFLDELARIRRNGYATAIDETMDGVSGAAAPVFGMEGRVIAGLAVLVPTVMWTGEAPERDLEAVRRAAARISESMGYHGQPAR